MGRAFDPEHEAVEDVEGGGGDDMVDRPYSSAPGGVHRHALVEHLVGDGKPLVHAATVHLSGEVRELNGRPPGGLQSGEGGP
jgi:hypothetical protein